MTEDSTLMSTAVDPSNVVVAVKASPPSRLPKPVLDGAAKRRPPAKSRRRAWKLVLLVAALAALAWGFKHLVFPSPVLGLEITATVRRATLPVVVSERGELESSKSVEVRCMVEGNQNKLVKILPEGNRVKEGEVVVEFDADQIKRSLADQEVKYKQAEGKMKAAQGEYEVAKNKADTDNKKAELDVILAKLDRDKYLQGEYKVEVDDKRGALELARRDFQEAEEKLVNYRKMYRQNYLSLEQLRIKESEVLQKKYLVDRDEAKLMVLEKFTKQRQEVELTAKAEEAERAVQRAKSTGAASVDKARSELEAAEVTVRLEKTILDNWKKQLDHCIVKAPQTGILVYSKERWWDDSTRIQAGAVVHYQQPLFSLPDLTQMQMKVKIHEALVKKVQAEQKAEIRIDAYPNMVLHATVKKVATLANAEAWFDRAVKEYETIMHIDDLPTDAGLKPGMTGNVKIFVKELPDVLIVPVQAVSQQEGQHYGYVVGDKGTRRREVAVGDNNDKFVEIKSGLEEGEKVTLDARTRLAEETKARDAKGEEAVSR